MININMNTIVIQSSEIDTTDIDGEKAMMNLKKGQYFVLNGVGSRIWDIINRPCYVKEIVSDLMKEYDVDKETCEQNTLEFLGRLNNAEIITIK
jgi:hypothetical protein